MKTRQMDTRSLVLCALFIALITVCAWISIPMPSGIFVTLQLLAVLLCAALLTPAQAALTLVAYALIGLIGVPVFSRMMGGPGALFGITGGYIVGFIPCAFVTSLIIHKAGKHRRVWLVPAMILGVLVCYLFGTFWFMVLDAGSKNRSLLTVLELCVIPYIPFDLAKTILAAILADRLEKVVKK